MYEARLERGVAESRAWEGDEHHAHAIIPADLASLNSKFEASSRPKNQSEDNFGTSDYPYMNAHLMALDKIMKLTINQMMKEQRSLSVGSLPGNLKSHILKTMSSDIV